MNASLSTLPVTSERSFPDDVYNPMSGCEYREVWSRGDPDRLTVTSWTHHGTSWVAATGTLDAATTPILIKALELACGGTTVAVVLNLTGLTQLDAIAVQLIATGQRRLVAQGLNLTTIVPLRMLRGPRAWRP